MPEKQADDVTMTRKTKRRLKLFWNIFRDVTKVLDGFHPSRLTEVQVGLGEDVFEALVVGENLTLIAQQILTSCYHSMNHHFKLEMKSWIAKLMFAQRSGKV